MHTFDSEYCLTAGFVFPWHAVVYFKGASPTVQTLILAGLRWMIIAKDHGNTSCRVGDVCSSWQLSLCQQPSKRSALSRCALPAVRTRLIRGAFCLGTSNRNSILRTNILFLSAKSYLLFLCGRNPGSVRAVCIISWLKRGVAFTAFETATGAAPAVPKTYCVVRIPPIE